MDNFGQWLIEILEEKGLSQSDLARRSGLSRGTLSNIVSGARGRGPDSLEAIAKALKLPTEQVYRMAGLLPPQKDGDPWVEEMAHKLNMIPANMRGVAGRFIESVIASEEPKSKPRKKAPSPSGRGSG